MSFQEEEYSTEFFIDLWTDFFKRYRKKVQKFDGSWVFARNAELADYHHEISLMPTMDRVTLIIDYEDLRAAVIHQGNSIAGSKDE